MPGNADDPAQTEFSPSDAESIGVVIMDDHLLVADGLAAAIESEPDMSVLAVAGTVAAGLEAVKRSQPDVLLLDQRLPDGLGTDSLPALFALGGTMKVLLVTAETSDEVMLKAIQGGCAGFLRKGSRVSELLTAIRAVARDEAVISPQDLRRLLPRLRGGYRLGDDLSPREREVLELLVEGHSTAKIAATLSIAVATVRNHVQSVIIKLRAHSRLEAVAIAIRHEVVTRS